MLNKNNIFETLYEQEVPAPKGMWQLIAQKLDEDEAEQKIVTAKDAPVYELNASTRKTNWTKIALAASVIGFVAMTALWLTNNPSNTTNTNTAATTPNAIIKKDTVYLQNNNVAKVDNTTTENIGQNPTNNTTSTATTNTSTSTPQNATTNTTKTYTPQVTDYNNNTIAKNNTDIVIRDADGNPIKKDISVVKSTDVNNANPGAVSKGNKTIGNITNKISLKSDNEELDSIIDNSTTWKKKIAAWRKTLIQRGNSPKLINSLDATELKKMIDKN